MNNHNYDVKSNRVKFIQRNYSDSLYQFYTNSIPLKIMQMVYERKRKVSLLLSFIY